MANERATRLPEIRHTLRVLRPALRRGIPTFITGDFNTPSHLDWTAAADAVRDDIHYPVAWPVTAAVQRAGFRDTYRVVHPDPVATPGITWTFGYPFPRIAKDEVVDRIDLVQASASVDVLDNRVLSRSDFWVVRRNAVPRVRAHQRGRRVRVAWHNAPGYRRDWIGIWRRGDNDLYNDYLSFAYTEASVAGSTTCSGLAPGRYVARLMMDDGYAEPAQASFTVGR